jgi:hypothetical protein
VLSKVVARMPTTSLKPIFIILVPVMVWMEREGGEELELDQVKNRIATFFCLNFHSNLLNFYTTKILRKILPNLKNLLLTRAVVKMKRY